jgi:hypothetical protein
MKRAWKLFAHNLSRLGGKRIIIQRVTSNTFENKQL